MVVTVSTEAIDSISIAFSTSSKSPRTRSNISLAVSAWPARSISIGKLSVTVDIPWRQTQSLEIARRDLCDSIGRAVANGRQRFGRFHHQGGLIALAAPGNGSEIRGVGFDEKLVIGNDRRGFANGFGGSKSDHAAEGKMEAEFER